MNSINMLQRDDKIMTWHPSGKAGVYISAKHYKLLCDFIFLVLKGREVTIKELIELGEAQLARKLDKNVSWLILVVKLDLEARGLVTSVTRLTPYKNQFLRLKSRNLKGIVQFQRSLNGHAERRRQGYR